MEAPSIPILAPFVLARVAALPVDALNEMSPPKTTANIDAACVARSQAEDVRPDLERSLYSAVQRIEPRSRSVAIELKRSVHNSRATTLSGEALQDLHRVLKPQDASMLQCWLDAQRTVECRLREAQSVHREEALTHVRPALRQLAKHEGFLQPLVMASRSLFERITQQAGHEPNTLTATKTERSILSYIVRASAKTSPFSTFMHLALMEADPGRDRPQRLDATDRASRTSLNRGVIFKIRRHSFGCCGDRRHALFAMSSTVKWIEGGGLEVMAPSYGTVESRLLRLSRCLRMRLPRTLALSLNHLPPVFTWTGLVSILTRDGIPALDADRLSERLYEYGVIDLMPWTDAFQSCPETSGRHTLDRCTGSAAAPLSAALDTMRRDAVALSSAKSGQRVELMAEIDAQMRRASQFVHADVGPLLRNPVMEDGFFRTPTAPIGAALRDLLAEVASVLRPRVEPSPSYVALQNFYQDLYGADGNCYDVVDFLCRAASALASFDPRAARMQSRPSWPFFRSAVPATVRLQITGDPETSASADNIAAVINRVYTGCGWHSARSAMGDHPFHESLREHLRKWIAALAAPAEPLDILISGDCNSLQAHPKLTDRVLACPLEPCLAEGKLSLRDVWLRCNARSGQIEMLAGEQAVAPVYLGTTFPNPAWGPLYWLTVLAAPWHVVPFDHSAPGEERVPGVFYSRRQSVGRVVTQRASWRISTERVRRVWFRRREAMRTADTAFDCARLGIPRRFFVRESAPASYASKLRKPMWVDTRNPFSLDLLEVLLRDAVELRITEALPDRPTWPMLAGRPHVAELHVELAL